MCVQVYCSSHSRTQRITSCVYYDSGTAPIVCNARLASLLRNTYLAPFTVNERCVVRNIDSFYIGPMGDEPLETHMRVLSMGDRYCIECQELNHGSDDVVIV